MIPRPLALAAAVAIGLAGVAAGHADSGTAGAPVLNPAQSQFLLRCGGCHGTTGLSPPKSVPVLRGRAGWFLCTPEGREYIVRVPNVARALLDDARLAAVLNFVAFDLGEGSAPHGAEPFTGEEVRAIRARPLTDVPLLAHRRQVVNDLIRRCGAPKDLLVYGGAG
ncbi:hypothetical protein [Edaphosphingomonas haloaromaticamans]|uniref:Cytochrome c-552 n=1 Tax=Edaphosphingomonas haloaromaticamans TaxID=653954 RepID=A0A1S1HID3_9SPHN|nr:hypothetical protein [Sphingomonas haloaromaticamans]OHT21837.1 Cytochrome c-552 precursor [Sphingomonas haloaromaticamans]